MTDAEFLSAVEGRTLPGEQWTHAAHVRLGWLYVTAGQPFATIMDRARNTIRRFNAEVLHKDAYHETITYAFLRLIAEAFRGGPAQESFEAFCRRCPELLSSDALAQYYSQTLLYSDRAREVVELPDLANLP